MARPPFNELAPFVGKNRQNYRQRLEIYQPHHEVLRFLAKLDHHVTYAELALDWLMRNDAQLRGAEEIISRCWMRPYHRLEHGVEFNRKTVYLARPTDKVRPTSYSSKPYRFGAGPYGNHPYCVHTEIRLDGAQALRRACIKSISDLVQFDHNGFWRKWLVLAELDFAYFGRMLNTIANGRFGRRKLAKHDYRVGEAYFQTIGQGSTQKTIDEARKQVPLVRRCLSRPSPRD
jgi:hypothetical protein